jgi:hypothetical protein
MTPRSQQPVARNEIPRGSAGNSTHQENPGIKKIMSKWTLGIFEKGGIEWSGGIVKGEEDNAFAASDGWHLSGYFHPCNKYCFF